MAVYKDIYKYLVEFKDDHSIEIECEKFEIDEEKGIIDFRGHVGEIKETWTGAHDTLLIVPITMVRLIKFIELKNVCVLTDEEEKQRLGNWYNES